MEDTFNFFALISFVWFMICCKKTLYVFILFPGNKNTHEFFPIIMYYHRKFCIPNSCYRKKKRFDTLFLDIVFVGPKKIHTNKQQNSVNFKWIFIKPWSICLCSLTVSDWTESQLSSACGIYSSWGPNHCHQLHVSNMFFSCVTLNFTDWFINRHLALFSFIWSCGVIGI